MATRIVTHHAKHSTSRSGHPGSSSRRVALIGVGGHGADHLRAMKTLAGQGLLHLVAVADPGEHRMTELAAELRAAGVDWFADYREMFSRRDDVDLVVICTPIHLHEEITLAALRETDARILLEKPAVPTLAQLERLVAADPSFRVRVGFHMLHWPQVQKLREWMIGGELGRVESVAVSAGWPRDDRYYQRAVWAGRMEVDGNPVFDGPATNALSHLLTNVCYLFGDNDSTFARPREVSGWLARARGIESYDTFFSTCRIGGTEARVFLTHAVSEKVPFEIRVVGERATAWLGENQPVLRRSDLGESDLPPLEGLKLPMYRSLLAGADDFHAMPGRLEDMLGYTEWTEQVRHAGPVREIDRARCFQNADGVVAVRGMRRILQNFSNGAGAPSIFPPQSDNGL